MATKDVRSKVKDINENMKGFKPNGPSSKANEEPVQSSQKTSSAKGDYIDFEEIK